MESKKLNLNKEVIATLNDDNMNKVRGGLAHTDDMNASMCYSYKNFVDSYCICKVNKGVGDVYPD